MPLTDTAIKKAKPGEKAVKLSDGTLLKARERMGYKDRMTEYGFRGVASTLLHEMGFDHAHIELHLAHQERDEVSAAYNRALPQGADQDDAALGDYLLINATC